MYGAASISILRKGLQQNNREKAKLTYLFGDEALYRHRNFCWTLANFSKDTCPEVVKQMCWNTLCIIYVSKSILNTYFGNAATRSGSWLQTPRLPVMGTEVFWAFLDLIAPRSSERSATIRSSQIRYEKRTTAELWFSRTPLDGTDTFLHISETRCLDFP